MPSSPSSPSSPTTHATTPPQPLHHKGAFGFKPPAQGCVELGLKPTGCVGFGSQPIRVRLMLSVTGFGLKPTGCVGFGLKPHKGVTGYIFSSARDVQSSRECEDVTTVLGEFHNLNFNSSLQHFHHIGLAAT
ncbi:hypothetical protein Tco_0287769 [Tanacetum coccineum]